MFLIYGGIMHFANMEYYIPYVPDFLMYKKLLMYVSDAAELLIGIGLFKTICVPSLYINFIDDIGIFTNTYNRNIYRKPSYRFT